MDDYYRFRHKIAIERGGGASSYLRFAVTGPGILYALLSLPLAGIGIQGQPTPLLFVVLGLAFGIYLAACFAEHWPVLAGWGVLVGSLIGIAASVVSFVLHEPSTRPQGYPLAHAISSAVYLSIPALAAFFHIRRLTRRCS